MKIRLRIYDSERNMTKCSEHQLEFTLLPAPSESKFKEDGIHMFFLGLSVHRVLFLNEVLMKQMLKHY